MEAYLRAAMNTARFDTVGTGGWFGALPRFHAVFACGDTEEACHHALQGRLERAIEQALQHGRPLPYYFGVLTPEHVAEHTA
jgi:predicted RNase H-like HicB family nuclease